jgi:GNAT superfamily N-acetyltransferase
VVTPTALLRSATIASPEAATTFNGAITFSMYRLPQIGRVLVNVTYGHMAYGQEEQVVRLIHGLMADYGADFESRLTIEALRDSLGFLNVEVAEHDGKILGLCAWVMSFSTWRGLKGMHVADHCVLPEARLFDVARNLLLFAARNACQQGARFIRTEVDITDELLEQLYTEVGFVAQSRHSLHVLEPGKFAAFAA